MIETTIRDSERPTARGDPTRGLDAPIGPVPKAGARGKDPWPDTAVERALPDCDTFIGPEHVEVLP